MPYVHRDANNNVTGLTRWPDGSAEFLPDNDPAVLAYRGKDLAGLKEQALAEVDGLAEAARGKWITLGPGQAMTYDAKRMEAERWAADGAPDPANYPWARARAARLNGVLEIDVTVGQAQAVIGEWTARAAAWEAAGIAIEDIREQAKEDIAAAADQAAIDAVLTNLDWPAPA